jgi:precorrin-8X/cobalt-precorrin-8 methylmutase
LMQPLFDAYVMVDWSASAAPKRGADSVWIASIERHSTHLGEPLLVNPETRDQALAWLTDRLNQLVAHGRSALVGFDFAFGFPRGFARRLNADPPDWRGVWQELARRIVDQPDNSNNRFKVASDINRGISGRAMPFWGCPKGAGSATLTRAKDPAIVSDLPPFRLTDRIAGAQSVWKLAYPGSVGSQTLLGIAALERFRRHPALARSIHVWPFEALPFDDSRPANKGVLVFAEIYPSMLPVKTPPDRVRDAVQIETLARHFQQLDAAGELAPLFDVPGQLEREDAVAVATEEGWILGIQADTVKRPRRSPAFYYLRDPEAIYRRSFSLVREAVNLSRLPSDLCPVIERLVHACGDPSIVPDIAYSADVAHRARQALASGRTVLADCEMVRAGIIRRLLPAANPVLCTLADVAEDSTRGTTRSSAAVDLWRPYIDGAVVAIGNAPTALFRLLELIDGEDVRPAAILGFPVGFVGATEAKDALIAHAAGVPFLTLRGRRGGSALAAAAVNALAGPVS